MDWPYETWITQLKELKPWASDCSEEFPKRLVHVYYCEICNSVLSLSDKVTYLQNLLYATANKCPICRFSLELPLRCCALNLRMPFNVAAVNIAKRNVTFSNAFRSVAFARDLSANKTTASSFVNSRHRSSSFGNILLDKFRGVYPGQLTVLHGSKTVSGSRCDGCCGTERFLHTPTRPIRGNGTPK
jgi:hypothetical protein